MNMNFGRMMRMRPVILILVAFASLAVARGEALIKQNKDSVECQRDGQTLWRFLYSTNYCKPCFHPLRVLGSEPLTTLQPPDHRWHYGLWFSWKYINGVNYWEERDGRPDGTTKWDPPKIVTRRDGSAEIKMNLSYVSPSSEVMMTEKREISVSAPSSDGGVTIDWTGTFTARKTPLVLDRTPMPGEEHGAVNGGYAGMSVRLAQSPAKCDFLTVEGPVAKFESDRARPNSKAAACNITESNRTNGVAILSDTSNTGGDSPWYMVNSKSMHWFSPVLLAPAPKKVKPHETFTWKFRIITRANAWTPEILASAVKEFH